MRSTQLSESLNSDMKEVVQAQRDKEISSEYESRKKLPRIQMRTPMLLQASKLYTPQIFEVF
ncbi:hypothetical protein ACP4OV_003584 [Aristida adscensionis]